MLITPSELLSRIKQYQFPDNFVLFLVFVFPILSLTVQHWLSGIYSLTALIATIVVYSRRPYHLRTEEKILFSLLFIFLLSFFLSATLNDWSDNSYRRVGNVMKYVFFFPLYLLIRQYANLSRLLLTGTVIGGTVLGIHAIYDVFVSHHSVALGKYGPIIFGDLAILYLSFTFVLFLFHNRLSRITYIYIIALVISTLAVYLSGSRNAWLAAIFCAFIIPPLCYKYVKYRKTMLGTVFILLTIPIIASIFSSSISDRLDIAINEFNSFIEHGAPYNKPLGSVDHRLESWRAALQVHQQAPWFGFGGGNAGKHVSQYAEQGLTHPDLVNPNTERGIGGLHSTYIETLLNEGIFGLIFILLFLLYPLYIFSCARQYSPLLSTIGMVFIINYMIFGTTENPFVHDNFSSVFLLLLAVFFSEVVRQKYQPGHAH